MKVGIVQMSSDTNKVKNIEKAIYNIDNLASEGCKLIILPEYVNFLGPSDLKKENSETVNGNLVKQISAKALQTGCYIHLGSFLEKEGSNIYNTSLVFDNCGQIISKYRKIHLFDVNVPGEIVHIESKVISAGKDIATFNIGDFVFGMATCYDLRFPELFRKLAERGANVFIVPSAFHLNTGRDHWEVLLRARAIENQSYVIASDQWKGIPEHICYGRSMAIDPWGIVISRASDQECNLVINLDDSLIIKARTFLPALKHRRQDLF